MATSFTYEPGSTFKAFTVGASLEEGLVTPHTTFDLPPTLQVADRTIEESHPRGYATMTVADILAQSSNVGAVTIGMQLNEKLGDDTFDGWIRKFGFGDADRNRLPRRGAGHRAHPGRVLRLEHGQPAARPGPLGHADPDRERVRRDRERRHPPHPQARPFRERPAGCRRRRRSRDVRGERGAPARDARGRARGGRHRVRRRGARATSSPARPVPRRRSSTASTPRRSTSARSSASRPPRIRACSSPSWSTRRPSAATTAATSRPRPSARSPTSPCPTWTCRATATRPRGRKLRIAT